MTYLLIVICQEVLRNSPTSYETACNLAIQEGEVHAESLAHELGTPFTSNHVSSKNPSSDIDQLTRLVEALTVNVLETSIAVKQMQTD
ncbi:hypothetical protein BGZ74_003940, partial [Mortierella antarctica]